MSLLLTHTHCSWSARGRGRALPLATSVVTGIDGTFEHRRGVPTSPAARSRCLDLRVVRTASALVEVTRIGIDPMLHVRQVDRDVALALVVGGAVGGQNLDLLPDLVRQPGVQTSAVPNPNYQRVVGAKVGTAPPTTVVDLGNLVCFAVTEPLRDGSGDAAVGQVLRIFGVELDHNVIVALDARSDGIRGVRAGTKHSPVLTRAADAPVDPLRHGDVVGDLEREHGLVADAVRIRSTAVPGYRVDRGDPSAVAQFVRPRRSRPIRQEVSLIASIVVIQRRNLSKGTDRCQCHYSK